MKAQEDSVISDAVRVSSPPISSKYVNSCSSSDELPMNIPRGHVSDDGEGSLYKSGSRTSFSVENFNHENFRKPEPKPNKPVKPRKSPFFVKHDASGNPIPGKTIKIVEDIRLSKHDANLFNFRQFLVMFLTFLVACAVIVTTFIYLFYFKSDIIFNYLDRHPALGGAVVVLCSYIVALLFYHKK